MLRSGEKPNHGQPRPKTHVNELRGEDESVYSDGNAPIQETNERAFKEDRESPSRAGDLFHVLQFYPYSFELARYACDGSRDFNSRVEY
jgi:hypothetical protein